MVFSGAQYMGDSLDAVYNGASKVVGWVDSVEEGDVLQRGAPHLTGHILVLGASAGMRLQLAPVQSGVTHTAIDRLIVYHSSQAALQTDL